MTTILSVVSCGREIGRSRCRKNVEWLFENWALNGKFGPVSDVPGKWRRRLMLRTDIGGAYSTCRGEEICMQGFGGEI